MLRLSVNGNQASGTYSDPRAWQGDATLTGTVNGRALEGQWFNPLLRGNTRNRGPVRFDLSPDGRSFTGYWREADGTGGGQWIGNCVGQAATAACGEPLSCTQCLGGGIRQKWLALGGERGRIGCPTTPELAAAPSPQGTTGRFAQFGGGDGAYIVWHSTGPKTGQAFVVEGCLFKSYHASGGTTSAIGFPVSDAYSVSGGVRQDFEGGYMAWNASTGQCWAHPAGSGGAQPSCSGGFAGTWDGGGGLVLQLSVTGDQATGTYTDPRGWQGNAMLSGTVRGRVLEGQWFNPILRGNSRNRGPVRFELAPDGRSFSGYWREEDGTGGANWTGSCTAGAARQPEAQANFGGVWACGGTLSVRMTQNGSQAQGTYQDTAAWQGSATVSGTVRGNVLEGRWFNQAYRGATRNTGPVRFEMSPNGNAWTGYWREADGSGGGGWNCSRVAGP
ncbi:MAG: hypothetical protein HY821_17655 [Acidobacteria bacterium]|nr:hypothetical protein [Acidobacteriota bacterium]